MLVSGLNRSWCRELVAVRYAKRLQIFILRVSSFSRPSWRSCRVCEASHRPVIAAMATLWALSRDRDWASVRLECQTGQAYSRCPLPSVFQNSVSVTSGTPRDFILLIAHVIPVAFLIISWHCDSHRSESCTITPSILCSLFTSSTLEPTALCPLHPKYRTILTSCCSV